MTKKLNGYVKWAGIILAILVIAFNSGVTYNHIHNLTKAVEKLSVKVEKLDTSIDNLNLILARENQ